MVNSSLVRLLRQLSSKQMSRLDKFLLSPYFTQSELLYTLFSYLKQWHPELKGEVMEGEEIHKNIFPKEKKYDKHRLDKKMSDLKKLVVKFLQVEAFEEDESAKRIQYAKSIAKFNDFNFLESYLKKYKWEIGREDFRGQEEYLEYFTVWQLWFTHPQVKKYNTKKYPLSDLLDCLDAVHASTKLAYIADILNRKNFIDDELSGEYIDEYVEFIKKKRKLQKNKTLALGFKMIELLHSSDNSFWSDFEKDFREVLEEVPAFERKVFYSTLQNRIFRLYHKEDKGQIKRLFQHFKLGIEKKYCLQMEK